MKVPDEIRPVWAEVNLDNIRHNVREIRRRLGPDPEIMAIVKANAYGHGAPEVAQAALSAGATWLGVAIVDEAWHLRSAGVMAPIHLLGMPSPGQAEAVVAGDFSCAIADPAVAAALSAAAVKLGRTARVQIKVDSGMGRLGLLPEDVSAFHRFLTGLPSLQVIGAFTHFAVADEGDKDYTMQQLRRFQEASAQLRAEGAQLTWHHSSNSAAIIDLPETCGSVARPGIMLYGLYPSDEVGRTVELRPAMQLKARVASVKRLPAGSSVSYGRTYVTPRETTIALLPLGYADGFSRLLSGKAHVLLKGRRMPVVGRICMDQCAVAVPDEVDVRLGDEAVIFGEQGEGRITIDEVAAQLGTINYEVVCMVGARVPRVYVENGEVQAVRSFLPQPGPGTGSAGLEGDLT